MKTLICFCLLFVLSQTALSQEYIPLINKENRWNILNEWESTLETAGKNTNILKFSSDTIIEGKKYSILLESTDSLALNWTEKGLLREDISARKIYFTESDFYGGYREERLLYDFGSQINDTILSIPSKGIGEKSIHYIVKSIDQVTIADKEHRRFTITIDYEGFNYKTERTWVEGIGDIFDLLFDANHRFLVGGSFNKTLLAFYQGDKLIYNPHNYETDFIWVPYYTLSNEQIEINPAFEITLANYNLTVKSRDKENYWIDLYSVDGKLLIHRESKSFEADIPLNKFQSGVYIVNVYSGNDRVSKKVQLRN